MENEIKVGELVRTRNKGIQKIAYLRPNATVNKYAYFIEYDDDGDRLNGILKTTDIVKHSKNIIDLIEVGDYVNGHLVYRIDNNTTIWIETETNLYCGIYESDIKSIVTKEQFASMEYKIKE